MSAKRLSSLGRGLRLCALFVFVGGRAFAASPNIVEIDTASGRHTFHVSVMRTEAEREKGLMFVKSMPKGDGMLFDFKTNQSIMMWMKNTLIGLDMVFIAPDGRIVNIAHNAKPEDETIIPSNEPALGVLEINAGAADAIGLKIGDIVRHPMFHDVANAH